MSFDINAVIKDMAEAVNNAVKHDCGDIQEYATQIMFNEKRALEDLGLARVLKQIDDETFDREIEREKQVVEAELLTISIMTKALAQRAINAALDVFTKAVRAAITVIP